MRLGGVEKRIDRLEKRMAAVATRLDELTDSVDQNTFALQSILIYLISKKERKEILRQHLKSLRLITDLD